MPQRMTASPETLERLLEHDLDGVFDQLADDASSAELYRALASTRWGRRGAAGHVSLSWSRAAALVDELRERRGRPPLDLAHTGGEGAVDRRIADLLGDAGWTSQPLDARRRDPAHLDATRWERGASPARRA
jgi:hypothetical protein